MGAYIQVAAVEMQGKEPIGQTIGRKLCVKTCILELKGGK